MNLLPWREQKRALRVMRLRVLCLIIVVVVLSVAIITYHGNFKSETLPVVKRVAHKKSLNIIKPNRATITTTTGSSHTIHDSISLNLKDVPVKDVLQMLANFAGLNLVISESVTGLVSVNMHELPWKQAMQVILTMHSLKMQRMDNVWLVETTEAFNTRMQLEEHNRQVSAQIEPLTTAFLQINYAKANDFAIILKDHENGLLSNRGSLSVDVRTNVIWVYDVASNIEKIKAWIKQLDTPRKQVMIEARIVNMTKDSAYDLGVRWGSGPEQSSSDSLEKISLADKLHVDLAAIPLEASPASVGIVVATLSNRVLLDLELSALESEGKAKIIARPRLMTMHQQAAVIESGEDLPYQESTVSGATSVAFKKAVLRLKVTPQITPDGKLLISLLINQDADSGKRIQGVPVLATKLLQTHVLVNNGQTIVLGGIYKKNRQQHVTRVPWLGSLPIMGNIFSRHEERLLTDELLVFVTPTIVYGEPS